MNYKYLLLLLTTLFGLSVYAEPVRLTNPAQAEAIFQSSELLEVQAGEVSITQLLQNSGGYNFVPTQSRLIKPKDSRYGYWLRFSITNETPADLFLHFVYVGTEHIAIYEVAGSQIVAVHQLGSLQPERIYPFLKSNEVCPITAKFGQTHTYYVYMEGVYTTVLPIYCRSTPNLLQNLHQADLFYGLYYGFILIIITYSFILYFRLRETDTLRYGIWVIFMGLQLALFRGHTNEFLWPVNPSIERYATVLAGITGVFHIPFTIAFLRLRQQALLFYKFGLGILVLYAIGILMNILSVSRSPHAGQQIDIVPVVALLEGLYSIIAGIVIYRRGFRPALFYVIGNLLFFASIFVFLLYAAAGLLPHTFWTYNSIHIGSGLEIILFTLALTYKVNLLKQQQEEAIQGQLHLTEANKRLVEEQNSKLEEKVTLRTIELNQQKEGLQTTLEQLRATQEQLIQKEKMASLGELMAGIAHEIQNPLNFVNNFSEISVELVNELKDELVADHKEDALDLADNLIPNLQKINHHGKRADAIVRGMLQHSRSSTGTKQLTNLNALADEYLRLAYHGLRAKDKDFNARLVTNFDANLGLVNLMPQEIARVLLNLYNNAFYAVNEQGIRSRKQGRDYEPTVTVGTRLLAKNSPERAPSVANPNGVDANGVNPIGIVTNEGGLIEIRIHDNGTGIPESVKAKIFQPFFTTKPSGEGTGLGLSLSYDIVTKGHGGTLTVTSVDGDGTEFLICLPVK